MRIKFVLLIVMITAIGTGSGVYAKPCTMTPEKAPTLFGFKLGMAQTEAEKLTGEKADENGVIIQTADGYINAKTGDTYIILFNSDSERSKILDNTAGGMWLRFMDGKLYEMTLALKPASPWVQAPNKPAFFQKQFGIPADAWVKEPERSGYDLDFDKKVTCKGVTVTVTASDSGMRFDIFETSVMARVDAAKQAAKKKDLGK